MTSDFDHARRFTIPDGLPRLSPGGASAAAQRRGACWVLSRSGAVAAIAGACLSLLTYSYLLAAELALSRAARAGALEATLPDASYESVETVVSRRMAGWTQHGRAWRVFIEQDGKPAATLRPPAEGGRVRVTVAADASAFLPAWLNRLRWWGGDAHLEGRGEMQPPGRGVRAATGVGHRGR